jgi:hypothetical protein
MSLMPLRQFYCAAMECMARGPLRVIFDRPTEPSLRADVRFDPGRTALQYVAKGQLLTHAPQQKGSLFDHLVLPRPTRNRIPPALPAELIRQPHRRRAQRPTFPRDWNPVVRSEGGPTQSSHVATGRLDILFANSQFRNMLEWEDPTARSDELTEAGTER